jgi:hypothetical protein
MDSGVGFSMVLPYEARKQNTTEQSNINCLATVTIFGISS